MTGLQRARLLSGLYLLLLRFDLASRGVTCDLEDSGGQMRLRVYCPGAAPAAHGRQRRRHDRLVEATAGAAEHRPAAHTSRRPRAADTQDQIGRAHV